MSSISPSSYDPQALNDGAADWLESLDDALMTHGPDYVRALLRNLQIHAQKQGVVLPVTSQTPYLNTIQPDRQPPYPGNRELERRIKSIIRWNAMAMVVKANRLPGFVGGHISTFASAATLYEVGQNHFFRGKDHACGGDAVYFQGHASPGPYARAFVEGRLNNQQLDNFRRELHPGGGLCSYPHPWLMPDFWEYPTVSMGLGPIASIYRARFMRYLDDRGIRKHEGAQVWAFLGDGECDEPESLGAITLASREKLDNLNWVINCNLQRLDGPVRGNSKIVQELEAIFRGAGWNVIKVLWGSDWDPLFAADTDGLLAHRLEAMVDGEYQKLRTESGAYIREKVFGGDERLLNMVANYSDDELWKLRLGGHDPGKVYAAYKAAQDYTEGPTVILAKTIKGYGLGEAGEGKNVTHNLKKLSEEEMLAFRDRFGIPITDEKVRTDPFYRPAEDSIEMQYLRERRAALGGPVPQRRVVPVNFEAPEADQFAQFDQGSGDRTLSTTSAYVRMIRKLVKDKNVGQYIVPIIPDEARTFGMDGMFREIGIYSHVGQLYDPVDSDQLAYYREATDGQILEEGINEAGSMCSFIAAGTSHASHGQAMIPFYIYYSMFGPQRIGDLCWLAGDQRCKGFLIGGTAGRTTLNGEGLQHQDGHAHLLLSTVPTCRAYDIAYAYELPVLVKHGIQKMYHESEDVFYYLSVGNEEYKHPAKPAGADEGIIKGMYKFADAPKTKGKAKGTATLMGAGSIMNCVVEAQAILAEKYDIAATVWGVTSFTELRREALGIERQNLLHPDQKSAKPYFTQCLEADNADVIVASSDYMKILPDALEKWSPKRLYGLGTDGFGRSEEREVLRRHFEVDAAFVVLATLHGLAHEGKIDKKVVAKAIEELDIDPAKVDPLYA